MWALAAQDCAAVVSVSLVAAAKRIGGVHDWFVGFLLQVHNSSLGLLGGSRGAGVNVNDS
jgi:hypothetical protein